MKKSVIFCFLTAIFAIAITSCKKDKDPVITITAHPQSETVTAGSITKSLSVTASVTEGATLAYQWYKSESPTTTTTGGAAQSGATSASFTIPASLAAGAHYFFCEVSAPKATSVLSNTATVTVNAPLPTALTVTVTGTYTYTGAPIVPTVTVKAGDATLTAADYDLSFGATDNTNAGQATVTATGKGTYNGLTGNANFTIAPKADATFTVTLPDVLSEDIVPVYNNAAWTPAVVVKWNERTLEAGADKDYTVAYANNVNASSTGNLATVTIAGVRNFAGSAGAGQFVIEKCSIKVVARNVEKIFWDDDPALDYDVTKLDGDLSAGLYGSDALTGELAYATGGAEVGAFKITKGTLEGGANYDIAQFVEGDIEIYYFKGDGESTATAYEIGMAKQLAKLAELVNAAATNAAWADKFYKLTDNINLNNAEWTPIGLYSPARPFRGNFDGNKKIVSGLRIDNSILNYAGLFGVIIGGAVQNLGVEGVVSGGNNVGGLAGYYYGGGITNCFANVKVSGVSAVGGLVGQGPGASGGGEIVNCYATGDVSGSNSSAGGLVGEISQSAATLINCYATGAVSGNRYVGGLAGAALTSPKISNSVALNPSVTCLTGTDIGRVGGRIGGTPFTNNAAWDGMTLNGAVVTTGAANDQNGADITTAQTKQKATYEALGWDFTTDWKIEEGVSYPKLKWEE